MNVCIIYPGYPPDEFAGGIGTYIVEMINSLKHSGVNVYLFTKSFCCKNDIEIEEHDNVTLFRIKYPFLVNGNRGVFSQIAYMCKLLKLIKKESKKNGFDIIEAADWGADSFPILFNKDLCKKLIIRVHTPAFIAEKLNDNTKSYWGIATYYFEKMCLKKCRKVLVPTKSMQNMLRVAGVNRNCIVDFTYPCHYITEEASVVANNNVFYVVGRIEERKGIKDILLASKKVRSLGFDFKVHFWGADTKISNKSAWEYFCDECEIDKNNNFLIYHGFEKRDMLLKKIKECNCLIMASEYELVGYSVIEALCKKKRVISRKVGAINEQFSENEILFFTDVDGLAKRMIEVLNQDNKKISDDLYNKCIDLFSPERCGEKYVVMYDRILEK